MNDEEASTSKNVFSRLFCWLTPPAIMLKRRPSKRFVLAETGEPNPTWEAGEATIPTLNVDRRPSFDDRRSSIDDRRPSFDDRRPSFDSRRSSFEDYDRRGSIEVFGIFQRKAVPERRASKDVVEDSRTALQGHLT